MKTILIPTDFHVQSVTKSADLLGKNGNRSAIPGYITDQGDEFMHEKIRIIFFHAFKLTDSISDLLMLRRRTAEYGKITDEFHQACTRFKEEHEDAIHGIGIEYFYGSTMAAFRNFVEANMVDAIFYPEEYIFNKISKYSIDPELFLKKSGLPMVKSLPVSISNLEKILHPESNFTLVEMA